MGETWQSVIPGTDRGMRVSMKNRIKELRTELGMTQEELANKAKVRRETIVFLEQGKYNPSLQLAHDVAVALKTTIDGLFRF